MGAGHEERNSGPSSHAFPAIQIRASIGGALAKLIINPTSGAKKEIPVGGKVISIGRDPSNDLVLTDALVSRRHAIMELKGEQYVLRDNNSSNGTLVNGDRVVDDRPLRDGDLIGIGSARILFHTEPTDVEAEESASPAPAAAKSAEPATVQPVGTACLSCGAETGPSDRHCRGCGRKLPERSQGQVVCGRCKAAVTLPAQYCGNCGEAVRAQDKAWAQKELRGQEQKPPEAPVRHDSKPTVPVSVTPSKRAGPPKPLARHPATGPARGKESPAGFWIRLAASIVDGIIVGLPLMVAVALSTLVILPAAGRQQIENLSPLVFILPSAGGFLTFLLSIIYPLYFWSTRGATPGKMVFHLRVVTEKGESPIGAKRAVLRLVGYFINSFTFGIGFLLIAFSADKRGLHDRLAETSVVRRNA